MPVLYLIVRRIWFAAKYLFLIVLASIAGATLGAGAGIAIAEWTGDPRWAGHGRCAGWTLLVLVAAVAPFAFVHSSGKGDLQKIRNQPADPPVDRQAEVLQPERFEGRFKSILVAPLVGALMGLIIGGIASGFVVALYFFAALSPLGPGGWWPILPLTWETANDGFSTEDPFLVIPVLIVVGFFVLSGFILGFFGTTSVTTSVGKKHYRIFGRSRVTSPTVGR